MTGWSRRRSLAGVALLLGALATVAGSPFRTASIAPGRIDVAQLAAMVAHEDDHVTALELAEWIKDRKPGLRVLDVRSEAEFDTYHIPTARRVPIDAIASAAFEPTDTIVLYSEGGAHAAQGWVFLRALGYQHVYFLSGGLYEWLDLMSPTLPANASMEAQAAFARAAALSRYFGGTPHAEPLTPTTGKRRRRLC